MNCVFCKRDVATRGHHIIPKCKGGKEIVESCQSCEDFIHSTWTHNELRDTYNNVETIVKDERFSKFVKWLLKQKEGVIFTSSLSNNRTHKGKYK
jgi:hypothetical protein